jgi:hypothetical protein
MYLHFNLPLGQLFSAKERLLENRAVDRSRSPTTESLVQLAQYQDQDLLPDSFATPTLNHPA